MDERLKHIVDNYDALQIGPDEPFRFHCTMCGKCCINREDILLSPRDIYRMAKELGLTPNDFVKQYDDVYIGGDSRFPIVRLMPRGTIKRCPLLKDRKCSVHKVKPQVCAMFPIGRCLRFDQKETQVQDLNTGHIEFIFTDPGCGDDSETHTVREWLGQFNIPLEDEYFIKWNQTVAKAATMLRSLEKLLSKSLMQTLWTTVYIALYLNYDTGKEFFPQFLKNAGNTLDLLEQISSVENDT